MTKRTTRRTLTAGVMLCLAITAASCSSDPDASEPLVETSVDGVLTSLDQTPSEHNVLSTMVHIEASDPVYVQIVATSGDEQIGTPETAEMADTHDVPVVGMKADRNYELAAVLTDADGTEVGSGVIGFKTGPLPEYVAEFSLEVDTGDVAPGYTFVEISPSTRDGYDDTDNPDPLRVNHVVAVDTAGDVVWYNSSPNAINDVRWVEDGTIQSIAFPFGVRRHDILGNLVSAWDVAPKLMPWQKLDEETVDQLESLTESDSDIVPTPIAVDGIGDLDLRSVHHEAVPMENGNILVLTTTLHEPTAAQRKSLCPDDDEDFWIISDVVVEVTPEGDAVKSWDTFDVVDFMETPGEEMCSTQGQIATEMERDWGHANAAIYDPTRDAIIVSNRHTSQITAMKYGSEPGIQTELLWTIGANGTIPLDGDVPRYQHAVEVEENGSLIFYDNGNGRQGTKPGTDNPPYSRAAIFEVDDSSANPSDWTATQTWEHRSDETDGNPIFAGFLGDADRLSNGNVLIDHGGIPNPAPDEDDFNRCVILEVVPATDGGEIIWDLRTGTAERPLSCYRTARFESFYSGGAWNTSNS